LQQPSRHTHIVGLRALLLPLFVSNRQKRSCVLIDHSIVVRILSGSLGKAHHSAQHTNAIIAARAFFS
jgi:hypothetical protein